MKDEKLIIRQAELLQQELETLVGKYPFGQDDVMSRLQVIANRAREHADRSFVILVAGPVKSGKSTFVNLVSNAFVSPTHFLECTVRPSIISAAEGDGCGGSVSGQLSHVVVIDIRKNNTHCFHVGILLNRFPWVAGSYSALPLYLYRQRQCPTYSYRKIQDYRRYGHWHAQSHLHQ